MSYVDRRWALDRERRSWRILATSGGQLCRGVGEAHALQTERLWLCELLSARARGERIPKPEPPFWTTVTFPPDFRFFGGDAIFGPEPPAVSFPVGFRIFTKKGIAP